MRLRDIKHHETSDFVNPDQNSYRSWIKNWAILGVFFLHFRLVNAGENL